MIHVVPPRILAFRTRVSFLLLQVGFTLFALSWAPNLGTFFSLRGDVVMGPFTYWLILFPLGAAMMLHACTAARRPIPELTGRNVRVRRRLTVRPRAERQEFGTKKRVGLSFHKSYPGRSRVIYEKVKRILSVPFQGA